MLEAHGDEGGDGEHAGHDLVDDSAAGKAHPHGQADEEVAQDAAAEDLQRAQGLLAGGHGHHLVADGVVARLDGRHATAHHHEHQQQRAHQVADVDDCPVAQHVQPADLLFQRGDHHEGVAGEELRAGDDHQDQADGEHGRAKDARHGKAQAQVCLDVGHEQSAGADEQAGGDGQPEHAARAHLGLGHADGLGLGDDTRTGGVVGLAGRDVGLGYLLFHGIPLSNATGPAHSAGRPCLPV